MNTIGECLCNLQYERKYNKVHEIHMKHKKYIGKFPKSMKHKKCIEEFRKCINFFENTNKYLTTNNENLCNSMKPKKTWKNGRKKKSPKSPKTQKKTEYCFVKPGSSA
jgi:hypothetical protein